MEILGASLTSAADTFLHSGYISAYPRALRPEQVFPDTYTSSVTQVDVTEALRLSGEPLVGAAGGSELGSGAVAVAGLEGWPTVLLVAGGFFLALALVYLVRERLASRWWRLASVSSVAAVLLLIFFFTSTWPNLPDSVPWKDVALQEYANPRQATQVLLDGIIADAIINVGQPIHSLANVQNEVGLPVKSLTKGQAYALRTYGIDGWGRAFRLSGPDSGKYRVTSAGEDGRFGTADDLSIAVQQCSNESWDQLRHAFFIRKVGDEHALFFHRWTGKHFRYHDREWAQKLTGGALFDVISSDYSAGEGSKVALESRYEEVAEGLDHEPLVLLVFKRAS